jgi:hypothetical protein
MSLLTNRKKSAAPCPDCKLTQDTATGQYKYGSDSTGYKTSSDSSTAKKKHQSAYPDAYIPKATVVKLSSDTTSVKK